MSKGMKLMNWTMLFLLMLVFLAGATVMTFCAVAFSQSMPVLAVLFLLAEIGCLGSAAACLYCAERYV